MVLSGNPYASSVNALRTNVQKWLGMQPVPQGAPTQRADGTPILTDNGYLKQLMRWADLRDINRNAFWYCILPLAFSRNSAQWQQLFLDNNKRPNVRKNCTDRTLLSQRFRDGSLNDAVFAHYLTRPSTMFSAGTLFDVLVPQFRVSELGVFFQDGQLFGNPRQRAMQTGFERTEYVNTLHLNAAVIWNAILETAMHLRVPGNEAILDELDDESLLVNTWLHVMDELVDEAIEPVEVPDRRYTPRDQPLEACADCAHAGTAWSADALQQFVELAVPPQVDLTPADFRARFPDVDDMHIGLSARNLVTDILGVQPVPQNHAFRAGANFPFVRVLNEWGQANPAIFHCLALCVRTADPDANVALVNARRQAVIDSNCLTHVNNYDRVLQRHRRKPLGDYMAKQAEATFADDLMTWDLPRFRINHELRDGDDVVLQSARRERKLEAGFNRRMQRSLMEEFVLAFGRALHLGARQSCLALAAQLEAAAHPLVVMMGRTIRSFNL